jgi:hypothetical protein
MVPRLRSDHVELEFWGGVWARLRPTPLCLPKQVEHSLHDLLAWDGFACLMVGHHTVLKPVGSPLVRPRPTTDLSGPVCILGTRPLGCQKGIKTRCHLRTSLSFRIRTLAMLRGNHEPRGQMTQTRRVHMAISVLSTSPRSRVPFQYEI